MGGFLNLNCHQQSHFVHKGVFRRKEGKEETGGDASFGPLELHVCTSVWNYFR